MRQQDKRYRRTEYVYGSAVRKLEPEYEREELERLPRRKQQTKQKPHKQKVKKESVNAIDFFTLICLTAAVLVTAYTCINYLRAQAQVTSMSKQVVSLESQIMELKNENDVALDAITSSIDLDHIYKVATRELGMVHPEKNQVISYKSTKSDSVKQYGDIPKGTKKSIVERIMGKE